MSIVESIRNYIKTFPLIKEGKFNIDHLGAYQIEYTIDTIPTATILKKYTDGSSLRQFEFIFASREFYGSDVVQNIANSEFYEKFADWIEHNNDIGILPELEEYRTPETIEITTSGYVIDSDTQNARYQTQLKLTYYQDRRYING